MRKAIYNLMYVWARELTGVFHDKGILIFILFVPLAYSLLYSYVYNNEVVRDVPAVAVDECCSTMSRGILRKIDATPDVAVIGHCQTLAEAEKYIQHHETYGIIYIPRQLDSDLHKGAQTVIGLYCDMNSLLYYKALLLAATDVSLEVNRHTKVENHLGSASRRDAEVKEMPVTYDHIPVFNPQAGFASFLVPPVLMLIFQQTLLLGIGMRMGNTREHNGGHIVPQGKPYRHTITVVCGRALTYLPIYFIMDIYAYTIVTPMFRLPQLGGYWTYLAFLTLFLLTCIFFAMTLSLLVYRREDCILLYVFLSVPMLFLSGIFWPGSNMPVFWEYFAKLFPSSFGLNGYVRIASMGCTLSQIRPMITGLAVQCISYFITTCLLYHRAIHSKKQIAKSL